jgi:hypothetical protein
MNPWLVPLGLLVVSAAIADVVGSLLGDSGNGGWATGPAGRLAWRALAPSRRRQSHGLSHLLGRLIVLAPPLAWLMGLWVGWSLVFLAGTSSVATSAGGRPASAVETIYFSGSTLFTLGSGKLQPVGGRWQLATVIATFTGFAILSLAVTYIILVVQAATVRRRIASTIASYGTTPAELTVALDSSTVDENSLVSMIVELAETHAAFPALHYLHTTDETRSAPAMIANLGLALGRRRTPGPTAPEAPLHRAISRYLSIHPPLATSGELAWDAQLERIRLDDGRRPEPRSPVPPP